MDLEKGDIQGKVLFVSDRSGAKQIYLKFMKTNMTYRLTDGPLAHYAPEVSEANGKVAYMEWVHAAANKSFHDLWTMELAGAKKRRITVRENVRNILWHPSGKALYFCSDSSGDYEIYQTGPEGEGRNNISQSPQSNETEFQFGRGGRDMAFVTDRDEKTQIYLTGEGEEKEPLRLTEEKRELRHAPVFSGREIPRLFERQNGLCRRQGPGDPKPGNQWGEIPDAEQQRAFLCVEPGRQLPFVRRRRQFDGHQPCPAFGHEYHQAHAFGKVSRTTASKTFPSSGTKKRNGCSTRSPERKATSVHRVKFDGTGDQVVSEGDGNCWLK